MAMVLCHLSDPHVAADRPESLPILEVLLADALDRGAGHVLLTGDVVDRPVPGLLRQVRSALQRLDLWTPQRLTVLPGNHDVSGHGELGPAERRAALRAFTRAFGHVDRPVPGPGKRLFAGRPVHKRLGPLELLGLSTASDHHPVEGRVLPADLEALERAFAGPKRGVRVVAVHQHPYPLPVGRRPEYGRMIPEGLEGGEALLAACGRRGVQLLLHGHLHTTGAPFDRVVSGVRVCCQGTARGERGPDGRRRRYGYDLWTLDGGARRRPVFLPAEEVLDRLLGH